MVSIFTRWIELLFPETCVVCGNTLRYSEKQLCTHCLSDIPQVYIHNKNHNPLETLLWGQIPFVSATSFMLYTKKNKYASILHTIKYKKNKDLGIFIGEMFGKELVKSGFLHNVDAIVPIPLHKKREQERGFNQSTVIAQGISNISQIPVIDTAVMRIRYTESQTKKNKEERLRNVANIFEVTNYHVIQNKNILLLDDVITTGATCISCAETILEQGFIGTLRIASVALAT
ncbi:MAG TPA: ComF family protein [Bacteroidales bacterium]|nr:ComF family protein [Bacteroidales bacterium]HRS18689.1 ComF family protein [Bacteroidales bacterium]